MGNQFKLVTGTQGHVIRDKDFLVGSNSEGEGVIIPIDVAENPLECHR